MKRLILFFGISMASCRTSEPIIKVYDSMPEQGGIVRAQSNEIIPYDATRGYQCLNPSDFEALLTWCQGNNP